MTNFERSVIIPAASVEIGQKFCIASRPQDGWFVANSLALWDDNDKVNIQATRHDDTEVIVRVNCNRLIAVAL